MNQEQGQTMAKKVLQNKQQSNETPQTGLTRNDEVQEGEVLTVGGVDSGFSTVGSSGKDGARSMEGTQVQQDVQYDVQYDASSEDLSIDNDAHATTADHASGPSIPSVHMGLTQEGGGADGDGVRASSASGIVKGAKHQTEQVKQSSLDKEHVHLVHQMQDNVVEQYNKQGCSTERSQCIQATDSVGGKQCLVSTSAPGSMVNTHTTTRCTQLSTDNSPTSVPRSRVNVKGEARHSGGNSGGNNKNPKKPKKTKSPGLLSAALSAGHLEPSGAERSGTQHSTAQHSGSHQVHVNISTAQQTELTRPPVDPKQGTPGGADPPVTRRNSVDGTLIEGGVEATGDEVSSSMPRQRVASFNSEKQGPTDIAASCPAPPPPAPPSDHLHFSYGNPRVEHITGSMQLFRSYRPGGAASTSTPAWSNTDCRCVCVLAIPRDMGAAEFFNFIPTFMSCISHARFVRKESSGVRVVQPGVTHIMVLLLFDTALSAQTFYNHHNARPFSSLEPDVVMKCVFVHNMRVTNADSTASVASDAALFPELGPVPPGQVGPHGQALPGMRTIELPSCPVCLERLDCAVSGIATTVCNHQFHSECLGKWGDTSCPVCRYTMQSTGHSLCAVCKTSENLWMCLICGHVGCGRYKHGHGVDHFKATSHCFTLEVDTGRVWDYVGDGYVHRLIQTSVDGKLVEVPQPAQQDGGQHGGGFGGGMVADKKGEGDGECVDGELHEAMLDSKLDAIAVQYNQLLVQQLDSQRMYYEGLLEEANQRKRGGEEAESSSRGVVHDRGVGTSTNSSGGQGESSTSVVGGKEQVLLGQLKRELNKYKKSAEQNSKASEFYKSQVASLRDDLHNELAINESLVNNVAQYKSQCDVYKSVLEKVREQNKGEVEELKDQVRDLMVALQAAHLCADGQTDQQGNELAQGSILPLPQQESQGGRGSQGKGKRINKRG